MGKESLLDVIDNLGQQLRVLGHGADRNAEWEKDNGYLLVPASTGINVIVEGFTQPVIDIIKEAYGKGSRFLYIATEEPTHKGFNWGTQKEMVERQKLFPEAAKYCEGILHLVPGRHITDWYGQFAPAAYVELGYAPALVKPQQIVEPEFDIGFFGSLSPRRLALLKRLANYLGTKKAVRIVSDFPNQAARDYAMQNAKVVVQIRKFEEMGLVSSSRCCTALYNGRPVLAEPHDEALSRPWNEIVKFTSNEMLFMFEAKRMVRDWRGEHARQFERFKAKLPTQACMGAALSALDIDILKQAA